MSSLWQEWQGVASVVGSGLLSWSWQAVCLLAATWLVASLVPRARAGFRAGLWLTALVLVPLLPLAAHVTPLPTASLEGLRSRWQTPSLTQASRPAATEEPEAAEEAGTPSADESMPAASTPSVETGPPPVTPVAVVEVETPPATGTGWSWGVAAAGLVLAWVVGAMVMLLRLGVSDGWVRKLLRTTTQPGEAWQAGEVEAGSRKLGVRRAVELQTSELVSVPVTVGILRPVIVLPTSLLSAGDRPIIAHALYHELAHVKRWDALTTVYRRLLEAALFFHPLVWLASRRYELEQEHVCDDWAVAALGSRSAYARSLAGLAEHAVNGRPTPALSFAHRPSVIRQRVTRILEGKGMPKPRLGLPGLLVVGTLALGLLLLATSLTLSNRNAEAAPAEQLSPVAEERAGEEQPLTAEEELRKALERRADLSFSETPLEDVADFLRTMADINVVVHRDLQKVDPSVTLTLKDVKLSTAFFLIAEQAGAEFTLIDSVILFVPKAFEAEVEALRPPLAPATGVGGAQPDLPGDSELKKKLDRPVSFHFSENPLEDVAEFLRTIGDINIVIHRDLQKVDPSVTLTLEDVKLGTALGLIAEQAGAGLALVDSVIMFVPKGLQSEAATWRLLSPGLHPQAEPTELVVDAELRKKLERPVSFDFNEAPLRTVVDFLRQAADINIVVGRDIQEEMPYTGRMHAASVMEALEDVADSVGGEVAIVGSVVQIVPRGTRLESAPEGERPFVLEPRSDVRPGPGVPAQMVLKHDDGTMEGRVSLGASGHFVQFQCPAGKWYLTEVHIFGSRYGTAQPPRDDFTITLCDSEFKTVTYIKKPYSIFQRGDERWYKVPVPPVELPVVEASYVASLPFWLNVAFNPSQTKGVYVGYDSSDQECFSKTGLPDQKPGDIGEKYDWMVRLVVTQDPPKEVSPNLGVWLEPRKAVGPWDQEGLVEIKNDDGESDGKMSMGGSGPAVRFENVPEGATLTRLRTYASRYGSGYDPETTFADYYVFDDEGRMLGTGRIPYALFTYEEQWVDVEVKPVKVPSAFWVLINPQAHQYKGIYTHYDTDIETTHSKSGRIPEEMRDLEKKWDWMIRAYVTTE